MICIAVSAADMRRCRHLSSGARESSKESSLSFGR